MKSSPSYAMELPSEHPQKTSPGKSNKKSWKQMLPREVKPQQKVKRSDDYLLTLSTLV